MMDGVAVGEGAGRDRGGPKQPLLLVRDLVKHFGGHWRWGHGRRGSVRAVDGLTFEVAKGETLGIVGESGCGKSTLARLIMQIIAADAGEILFDGEAVGQQPRDVAAFRREAQMVFQDSSASLNPRLTVEETIAFGPWVHGSTRRSALARAHDLIARVGLEPARFAARYPHELSGGQRQRINIARALAVQPRLLILDEAVSALDKSVEAQVINLLLDLKSEFGLTYIFISHDLTASSPTASWSCISEKFPRSEPATPYCTRPAIPIRRRSLPRCPPSTPSTAPSKRRCPATRPTRSIFLSDADSTPAANSRLPTVPMSTRNSPRLAKVIGSLA
jgi:peptide/nickel transport system ATP-binding protein